MLDIFQENGFAIVADDLAQETRNFRQDVPDDDDALMALARAWNEFDGCSLATDVNKPKGQMIIDAVKKAGNDDLTAGVFVMAKHLVDQDPRIGRFQYGDRRHDLFQPACAANNACMLQGRQLQQVGYSHAHALTSFLIDIGL